MLAAARVQFGHQTRGDFLAGLIGDESDFLLRLYAKTDKNRVMRALRKLRVKG